MPESAVRIAALAIALSINAAVFVYLTIAMSPPSASLDSSRAAQAIQVFLLPPDAQEPSRDRLNALRERPRAKAVSAEPKAARPLRFSSIAKPDKRQKFSVSSAISIFPESAANDDWSRSLTSPLGSGAADTYKIYRPDSFDRRPAPIEVSIDRMGLAFQDRSAGGRLQAFGRRLACKELAAALSKSPASANAIMASMKDYGCGSR